MAYQKIGELFRAAREGDLEALNALSFADMPDTALWMAQERAVAGGHDECHAAITRRAFGGTHESSTPLERSVADRAFLRVAEAMVPDLYPAPALHAAAAAGEVPFDLVAEGVSGVDGLGRTALHRAAEACRAGAVRALLAAGADPNARDCLGDTPLIAAVTQSWRDPGAAREVVEELLRHADPDSANSRGVTALHFAAFENLTDLINLLAAGAAPNPRDDADLGPADYAKLGFFGHPQ